MTQNDKEVQLTAGRKSNADKSAQSDKSREAMPILELRRFLADELDGSPVDGDFGRSFTPLTDGLGIAPPVPKPAEVATKAAQESRANDTRKAFFDTDPIPPKAEAAAPKRELPIGTVAFGDDDEEMETLPGDAKVSAPSINVDRQAVLAALGGTPAPTVSAPAAELTMPPVAELPVDLAPAPKPTPIVSFDADEELSPTERLAADRMIERSTRSQEPTWSGERIFLAEEDPRKVELTKPMHIPEIPPPPMPDASLGRRLLAAILDQAFVLTLWGITLTITSAVLGGGIPTSFEMLASGLRKEPVYWRFAILSFATLWLAHFAIGLGILDRTFGMWVWGLKVRAFGKTDESSFFRRLSRIVLSFFFYAPVAPVLLLAPRYKGRNLLDWMTGTALYRTLE